MRTIFALACLALIFCLALPVVSNGQDAAEEICACYQKEHGQLRIVSDPSECLDSEVPIFLSGRRALEIPSLAGTTWKMKPEFVSNEAAFTDPEAHFPFVFPPIDWEGGDTITITEDKVSDSPYVRFLKGEINYSIPYYGGEETPNPPYNFTAILIKNEIHMTPDGGTIVHAKYVPGDPPKFEGCTHHVYQHNGNWDDAYNPHTSYFVLERIN